MATSRGDLDRMSGDGMAAHVGQVRSARFRGHERDLRRSGPGRLGHERIDQRAQIGCAADRAPFDQFRLRMGGRRHDHLGGGAGIDQRQGAGNVAQRPVETEFGDEGPTGHHLARELLAGHQHPDGDGQVERGPDLAHRRRRQVHGGASIGPREARGEQRGAHAVARLATRRVGQPDDGERRQSVADVHLDGDRRSVDPRQGRRGDGGEHRPSCTRTMEGDGSPRA